MPVKFEHPSEFGDLTVYVNAEYIRPASKEEQLRSKEAARNDGGRGVIDVGGVQCFVND
jgi:hypothetical protein